MKQNLKAEISELPAGKRAVIASWLSNRLAVEDKAKYDLALEYAHNKDEAARGAALTAAGKSDAYRELFNLFKVE